MDGLNRIIIFFVKSVDGYCKNLYVQYVVMFLREKQLRQNVRFATQAQISSKSRQAKENGLQNTLSVLLRALAKTSLQI